MAKSARTRVDRALRFVPSLVLPFWQATLDPRVSVIRPSSAMRINETGVMELMSSHVPRFDYDPVTLACRGLLIEGARTNLVLRSTPVATGGTWTFSAQTSTNSTFNSAVNIDGTPTAATLWADVGTVLNANDSVGTLVPANITVSASTLYTATFWVKPDTSNLVRIRDKQTTGMRVVVDMSSLVVTYESGSSANWATVAERSANGFVAIRMTRTTGAAETVVGFDIKNGENTATGATIFIGAYQLEAGGYGLSYIPTNGAAATRALDDIALTSRDYKWYNPNQGTCVAEMFPAAVGSSSVSIFKMYSNPAEELLFGGGSARVRDGTNSATANPTAALTAFTFNRLASSYGPQGLRAAIAGAISASNVYNGAFARDQSFAANVPFAFHIGRNGGATTMMDGWIRYFAYYPQQADDALLKRVSSPSKWAGLDRAAPSFSLHLLDPVMPANITFVRATGAARVNASGVLVTESANVPRFDYDPITLALKGLLIEGTRTNSIARNDLAGAVPGTPGTLPTGWSKIATGSVDVVGTGTELGVPYIDLRFSSAGAVSLDRVTFQQAGVTAGATQTWCHSYYAKLVAGSFTNVSVMPSARITWRDAGFSLLSSATSAAGISATATNLLASRVDTGAAVAPASTSVGVPELVFSSSGAYDFTLRIAMPQMEQGAMPSSPIATTGAAATRDRDQPTMSGAPLTSWFRRDQGAFVAQVEFPYPATALTRQLFSVDDGTLNNRIMAIRTGGTSIAGVYTANNVAYAPAGHTIPAATPLVKFAMSYATASTASRRITAANGVGPANSTAGPPVWSGTPSTLRLGHYPGGGNELFGWFQHLDYYAAPTQDDNVTELSR